MKTVLITGCSSGVGLSLSILLGLNNFKVYATLRNLNGAQELEKAIKENNLSEKVLIRALDVCKAETIELVVKEIIQNEGRIDVLVNNAGYSLVGTIEMLSLEKCRQQFETNFFGVISTMKAVLPYMRSQTSGTIVNIST